MGDPRLSGRIAVVTGGSMMEAMIDRPMDG